MGIFPKAAKFRTPNEIMVFVDFLISLFYKNKAAKNVGMKCYSRYYSSEVQRQ